MNTEKVSFLQETHQFFIFFYLTYSAKCTVNAIVTNITTANNNKNDIVTTNITTSATIIMITITTTIITTTGISQIVELLV